MTLSRPASFVCSILTFLILGSSALALEPVSLPQGDFGLSVAWERELGSGYSKVAVADGRAVTMFAEGESDILAAIDPATGEEFWRYELGEIYKGHSGSDDGPLSNPVIDGDRVFALGPRGNLVALALADGTEIWRHQLDEENSTPPFYGYTSTPVIDGDLLLLATGGEGHAMTAFDKATGEIRWTAGNDSVRYQTPRLFELGGRPTLVLVGDNKIQGFDPGTGEVRFEHEHGVTGRASESSHVTPVGDDRFLANHFGSGSAMYHFSGDAIEEVWRSPAFGNSLAIPVLVGDHLYGFTGRFLTCADVETGEIVWRSRPPLARGLEVVDGRLAVLAASGDFVLIDPVPDGYREITRVKALESGDYATASFTNETFLLRNLESMAAVRIDATAAPQQLGALIEPGDFLEGEMTEWVASVLAMPEAERQPAVDARFADVEAGPLFEDGGIVHFFYRGDVEDVGIEDNGGDLVDQAENGMFHVSGTDLFVRSSKLDPKAQYTYAYTVDYSDTITDPNNPHTVDNGFNVVSELRMPEWPASPHLEEPAEGSPRGELDSFPFRSETLDNTRQIQVWRPPGYGGSDARYPLLIVNHGDNLLRGGLMRNTLDNLVGKSVAPVIVAFVPRVQGPEYGGERVDDYVRFLVEELVPHIDRHYLTDPGNRAIMGPGSAGLTALYAALKHSDHFQGVAAQSLYPIEPAYDRLAEMVAEMDPAPRAVHLVWSNRDYDLGDGRTAAGATQELLELLRGAGINVTEQVADYSPGWGGWRGQHDEVLTALFPVSTGEAATGSP